MSGARTRSDGDAGLLGRFLELRGSLGAERIGRGGSEVCAALTAALDEAIGALAADFGPGSKLAVVAMGGYGRGELSPFSDVDLMLLHDVGDPSEAAATVFRPLWDAGLRLGHAVRNPREAAKAARERFDTFTTLLTSRLVAGDPELYEGLATDVAWVTKARLLRRYLVGEEIERRGASPYLLMATDVKEGRGGLRTLHGFEWERRREALIGRYSAESGPEEEAARETLLGVRNALHAVAGRRYDVYSYDLRQSVARWLGTDEYEVGEALVEAMQTVDRLAADRWSRIVAGSDPPDRRTWWRRGGDGGTVGEYLPSVHELVAILRAGEPGRRTIQQMRESGHLDDLLPEWEAVRTAPQLAPFHEHPVEAHLWRTVDEMQGLVDGADGHYSAVAAEIDSPDLLTVAAFLHDIGKGGGGAHAERGAGIARSFCERLMCPADFSMAVEAAVRHHLLLSRTATRRDLDDPAVIAEVAETVGDLRLLQVLYLLTVADSRATGATMWNNWKATLVRTLFIRCAALFGADQLDSPAPGTTRAQVLGAVGSGRRHAVEAHVDGMPEEYLRSTPTDAVLWHLSLIDQMRAQSNLDIRVGEAAQTAAVVGRSRRHFRRIVAESFAANGIDVLEARLTTRVDGIIVDSFQVRDDRTGGTVSPERWDRARADIEAAFSGGLDTESKVAARAEAYSTVAATGVEPQVTVSIDDASNDGVITIRCADRIGRLAEVLSILRELDLEIRLAKLDSRGGEVIDVFHVPIASVPAESSEVRRLEQRIQRLIKP